jgi:hypothetical protein
LIFLLRRRLLHGVFVDVEFVLESISEPGQVLVTSNPIHSLFGLQQTESEPPRPLFGMVPALDVADVLTDETVEIPDRIGGL